MKFLLCNEFEYEVEDSLMHPYNGPNTGTRKLHKRPYTHYLLKKQLDIACNLWCLDSVVGYIPEGYATCVVDYFAGVGCSSKLLWHRLSPADLISMDLDETCVDIMRTSLPFAKVQQADFFDVAGQYEAELALLDMETFTILQLDARMMDALRRVIDTTDFIILPDTAVAKYWLNVDAYNRVYRKPTPDLHTYMEHMAAFMNDNYGMALMAVAYHTRASYMLYHVGGCVGDIIMDECPESAESYFRKL